MITKKEITKKEITKKEITKKEITKKERLIRLSVRVSPKAAKAIGNLQSDLGESLSSVLREVIDEGLKAKKKDLTTED